MMSWADRCAALQGGWMMFFGMVMFWGLLLFLGAYFLKTFKNGKKINDRAYLNILQERQANGEISEDEYDRLKQKRDS